MDMLKIAGVVGCEAIVELRIELRRRKKLRKFLRETFQLRYLETKPPEDTKRSKNETE